MRLTIVLSTLALASSLASADPFDPKQLPQQLATFTCGVSMEGPLQGTPPRFAFTPDGMQVSPDDFDEAGSLGDFGGPVDGAPVIIGKSADGKAAWIAVDLEYGFACGMEGCDKIRWPRAHVSAVFDDTGHAVTWHVGQVSALDDRKHPPAKLVPKAPDKLPDGIDAGAEDVVKLFKASSADPAALAKTVSDRKDAVLFGSEKPERYVGGAKIRAQLAKWGLGFAVRDGVQAGLSASKTVAWLAANVDAAKKGSKKTTPYRVSAIYEKTAAGWQLVVLHFSSVYK